MTGAWPRMLALALLFSVNERDLAGVGIWRLNYGADRHDFYSLIRDEFGAP